METLSRPEIPKAKDINLEKAIISQLTPDEQDKLKLLCFDYKYHLQLYERQDIAMSALKAFI